MNVILYIFDKLQYFAAYRDLLMMLTSANFATASDRIKGYIAELFRRVDENTDDYDKQLVIEAVREIAFHGKEPAIFRVNEGEDFCLKVDLEPGRSFQGFNLVARDARTGLLLSDGSVMGMSYDEAPVQAVTIYDLPFAAGGFYRVHVLLEHPDTNQLASGDASTLLTDAILIVYQDIDSDK
jgi:hypothetical protein